MTQNKNLPRIQFLGAAKTVTGSKTLLTVGDKKILIDCGLFQGPKEIRQHNWHEFRNIEEIDAIILTHAHIDHSGYLPKLVKEGYKGPIYCSPGTFDLCKILLPDSGHLQEEDARYANKTKHSRHHPALPLYTERDAREALHLFETFPLDEWIEIFPQIHFRLLRAGHILGSTFVQINMGDDYKSRIITFSGDVGNSRQNVIKGPVNLLETDYLVLEGTYGDRMQSRQDPSIPLAQYIKEIVKTKGVLVIPSFAVGRTQEILFLLRKLENENKIPNIPVYLDSPMAIEATDIYLKHKEELKLQLENGEITDPLCPTCYTATRSVDESFLLCMQEGPMVVVSAAGMLTGGRILHHLKKRLPDPRNILLFVGFQVEQTKGRLLQQGLPRIRIHHQEVDVEARIESIDSLSAHADTQDLIEWVQNINHKPKQIFLNHGEEAPLRALKYRLENELQMNVVIPEYREEFVLDI